VQQVIFSILSTIERGASLATMPRLFYSLAAAMLAPALMGVGDAWAWVMLGEQASGLVWSKDRALVAFFLAWGGAAAWGYAAYLEQMRELEAPEGGGGRGVPKT
jgi:hypothetical protein